MSFWGGFVDWKKIGWPFEVKMIFLHRLVFSRNKPLSNQNNREMFFLLKSLTMWRHSFVIPHTKTIALGLVLYYEKLLRLKNHIK